MRWPSGSGGCPQSNRRRFDSFPHLYMDKINQHIESLLNTGKVALTDQDQHSIKQVGLEEWVLRRLLSKKFRKTKAEVECVERTKVAINNAIKNNEPLPVYFFQGAYKLWRLPSTPEADWAEFFNISYLLEYLAPIAAAYKPGVNLVYYMHTLLMEAHDNLTTEEINQYIGTFNGLLNIFGKKLPNNITISVLKDADIYPREDYFPALEHGLIEAQKIYEAFPPEKKADYVRMSKLNIKWQGKDRWDLLSKNDKEKMIYKSGLYEVSATLSLPKVMEKVKAPENVLVFTKANPMMIGIGSTKTSMAKYWVGIGVLEWNKDKLQERVLTPSQWEKAKKLKHEVIKVNKSWGKNFKEILVFPQPLLDLK